MRNRGILRRHFFAGCRRARRETLLKCDATTTLIDNDKPAQGYKNIHRFLQLREREIDRARHSLFLVPQPKRHLLSRHCVRDLNESVVVERGRIRRDEKSGARHLDMNEPVFSAFCPGRPQLDVCDGDVREQQRQGEDK